jgi:2'-5' RNA ligase
MIRAFLAIELDDQRRSALAVQQFLLPLPRKEPIENLHLTLVFLGELREAELERAHEAIAALKLPSLSVELSGLGLFGGERPRAAWAGVAPNPDLMRLQQKLETAVRRAGLSPEARRYLPHVTLGRFRPPPLDVTMRLERAIAEQSGFRVAPMPVSQVVLYESIRQGDQRRYEELVRYPLG